MPLETAIVVIAILVPFAVFAAVLAWGDRRTRRPRRPDGTPV